MNSWSRSDLLTESNQLCISLLQNTCERKGEIGENMCCFYSDIKMLVSIEIVWRSKGDHAWTRVVYFIIDVKCICWKERESYWKD